MVGERQLRLHGQRSGARDLAIGLNRTRERGRKRAVLSWVFRNRIRLFLIYGNIDPLAFAPALPRAGSSAGRHGRIVRRRHWTLAVPMPPRAGSARSVHARSPLVESGADPCGPGDFLAFPELPGRASEASEGDLGPREGEGPPSEGGAGSELE